MTRPQPLFDKPTPAERPLSRMYTALQYRVARGAKATYTTIKNKTPGPCDECFANQHELPHALPRADAKERRALQGGPALRLCRAHAGLWRERDERDGASV